LVQADTDKDHDHRVALIQLASSSMVLLIKVTVSFRLCRGAELLIWLKYHYLDDCIRLLMIWLADFTDNWAGLHA
jgi:hypothetical protein